MSLTPRPILLLGNLASILVTIAGMLQAVSWTIAGATILAILSITTLVSTKSSAAGTATGRSNIKKTGHSPITDHRHSHENMQEKQGGRGHQQATMLERNEVEDNEPPGSPASHPRSESQKTMAPNITPQKTPLAGGDQGKTGSAKSTAPGLEAPRASLAGTSASVGASLKPGMPRLDPNTRILARGDYATFDVELEQRTEVTCEVTANAPVNVYLMDKDNVNSLDLGEEFWSERGEEGVEEATLHFVASETGKWFLVVENTDNREVSATVKIQKRRGQPGSS